MAACVCRQKRRISVLCRGPALFLFVGAAKRKGAGRKNWNNPPVQRNTMEAVLRDPAEKSGRNGAETEKTEKDVRSRKGAGPENPKNLQII